MPEYAILDGKLVVNVIVADSKEIAQAVTGMEVVETSGEPWINWTLEEEGWRRPSPYFSWIWNGQEWEPPIPMPEKEGFRYSWNEQLLSWDEHENINE